MRSSTSPGSRGGAVTQAPRGGLYAAEHEHDSCGVAFVADLSGQRTHHIVDKALHALRNLEHRGASGSEPDSGDGAGILTQVPDAFYREVAGVELPVQGAYAVGTAFLPVPDDERAHAVAAVEAICREEGLRVLGWRDVPVAPDLLGATARAAMPVFRQLFVAAAAGRVVGMGLERMAFCARKRAEREA
ncbi:MAG: glutamate synthase subunit alpha, partial [Streptosporangiales bacterium]|nr:glutamate synthase subunit alpha [Streptosporangiales bacterium]